MRYVTFVIVITLFTSCSKPESGQQKETSEQSVPEKSAAADPLSGKWRLISLRTESTYLEPDIPGTFIEFKNGVAVRNFKGGGESEDLLSLSFPQDAKESRYVPFPEENPKALDLVEDNGRVFKCTYARAGDALTIAMPQSPKYPRPTSVADPDRGGIVLLLQPWTVDEEAFAKKDAEFAKYWERELAADTYMDAFRMIRAFTSARAAGNTAVFADVDEALKAMATPPGLHGAGEYSTRTFGIEPLDTPTGQAARKLISSRGAGPTFELFLNIEEPARIEKPTGKKKPKRKASKQAETP